GRSGGLGGAGGGTGLRPGVVRRAGGHVGREAQGSGDDGEREDRRPLPTPWLHSSSRSLDRRFEPTTLAVNVSTRVAGVPDLSECGASEREQNVSRTTLDGFVRLVSRPLGRAAG